MPAGTSRRSLKQAFVFAGEAFADFLLILYDGFLRLPALFLAVSGVFTIKGH